jgi:DNA-binding MurR/RpiR family transcriptional regulator
MNQATSANPSQNPQGGALIRLRGLYPSLKAALQKVADAILRQPEMAIYASVNEVAAVSGVSEATVMRFCRVLGFKGFQDFKIALAREMVTAPRALEEVPEGDADHALVRQNFQTSIAALQDTMEVLDLKAMVEVAQLLMKARQIVLVGAGLSGPIVDYTCNRFFRLGLQVRCYSDVLLMKMAASLLTPADVLIAVSYSGGTRETLETARLAKETGARVICLTNNSLSPLARLAHLPLVTATRETSCTQECQAGRLCQLCIIDSLFSLMAQARPELARENQEKIEKVMAKQF